MSQKSHLDSIAVNVEGEREEGPTGQRLHNVLRTCPRKIANGDMSEMAMFEDEGNHDSRCRPAHSNFCVACPVQEFVCHAVLGVAHVPWPLKLYLALFYFAEHLPDTLLIDEWHSRLCLRSTFRDLFAADRPPEASKFGQTVVGQSYIPGGGLAPFAHLLDFSPTVDDCPSKFGPEDISEGVLAHHCARSQNSSVFRQLMAYYFRVVQSWPCC